MVHYNGVIRHIIGIHIHTIAHLQEHQNEHKHTPRSSYSACNTVLETVAMATTSKEHVIDVIRLDGRETCIKLG